MTPLRVLPRGSSFEDTRAFLASCKRDNPIETFDDHSNMRLIDLYREFELGEAWQISENPETGVADIDTNAVRGIIRNLAKQRHLVQISKTYPNGNTVPCFDPKVSLQQYSFSETIETTREETVLEAFLRGLEHEFGVNPSKVNLQKIRILLIDQEYHASSVYDGIWRRRKSTWIEIDTKQLSSRIRIPKLPDNGVVLNREWFDD